VCCIFDINNGVLLLPLCNCIFSSLIFCHILSFTPFSPWRSPSRFVSTIYTPFVSKPQIYTIIYLWTHFSANFFLFWFYDSSDVKYYSFQFIKCKDGSKSFSKDRLNDNFCDCSDGTDEPGMLIIFNKI
jgi:hypothetical protein